MLGVERGMELTGLQSASLGSRAADEGADTKLLEQEAELQNHMELLRRYLESPSAGRRVQPTHRLSADELTREELERRLIQAEEKRADAETQAKALLEHLQRIRACYMDGKAEPSPSQMSPLAGAFMDAELRVAAASTASTPAKRSEESPFLEQQERERMRQHSTRQGSPSPADGTNEMMRFHAALNEILADSRNRRKLLQQERESFWKGMDALQVQLSPGTSPAKQVAMEWPAEAAQVGFPTSASFR
mmetsp:Transcript_22605/g.41640  ORF Transcript_22605/g.41640 Transcript_22605/m.41640 type:complete len:248 (-) Transcript_22605:204-947(-)